MTGPADLEKWYTIWKYAAGVNQVCVISQGRDGTADGLGE